MRRSRWWRSLRTVEPWRRAWSMARCSPSMPGGRCRGRRRWMSSWWRSPSGGLLALSQIDGEVLLFDVDVSELAAGTGRAAPAEEYQRALAAREAGQTDAAREALLRVLDADPGHLAACDALIALDQSTHAAALAEADRLAAEGRFAEALEALEAGRTAAPTDPELPQRWAAV